MKRVLLATVVLFCWSPSVVSAQTSQDAPATKEDVERYLEAMNSREMMRKMADAMSKPMHQMVHEQYEKQKDKLPPDFEARMNKLTDDYMKDFPWDEMLEAMIPVYQNHFTKGDIDQLVAFYSTATGKQVLKEMPAVVAEAMQAMMPIMNKKIEAMTGALQQQIAEMVQQSEGVSKTKQPTKN